MRMRGTVKEVDEILALYEPIFLMKDRKDRFKTEFLGSLEVVYRSILPFFSRILEAISNPHHECNSLCIGQCPLGMEQITIPLEDAIATKRLKVFLEARLGIIEIFCFTLTGLIVLFCNFGKVLNEDWGDFLPRKMQSP